MSYIQEVYFTDGTIEKTEFKDYADWYYNSYKARGVARGPLAYDGEGCSYQTTLLKDGAEGLVLFDDSGVVSYNIGTIGGFKTSLIFDYSHLPLWRKYYPDRQEEHDAIEAEYKAKIEKLRSR